MQYYIPLISVSRCLLDTYFYQFNNQDYFMIFISLIDNMKIAETQMYNHTLFILLS